MELFTHLHTKYQHTHIAAHRSSNVNIFIDISVYKWAAREEKGNERAVCAHMCMLLVYKLLCYVVWQFDRVHTNYTVIFRETAQCIYEHERRVRISSVVWMSHSRRCASVSPFSESPIELKLVSFNSHNKNTVYMLHAYLHLQHTHLVYIFIFWLYFKCRQARVCATLSDAPANVRFALTTTHSRAQWNNCGWIWKFSS